MKISNQFTDRQRNAIAAIVFILSALLATALILQFEKARVDHERVVAFKLADEHAHAIGIQVDQSLSAVYALAAIVQLHQGKVDDFENTARQLLAFYPGVSALQLAPGGVIAHIEPLAGNEKALGHNLLTDPARDKEAFLARDTGKLTLAGPFMLRQGGLGAAGRLPVYLDDEQGKHRFWGFVIVLLRFPETLGTAQLAQLTAHGHDYQLWRMHPVTGARHVIAASTAATLIEPVERTLSVPNTTWTLSLAPKRGWSDPATLAVKAMLGLLFSLLVAYCTQYLMPG